MKCYSFEECMDMGKELFDVGDFYTASLAFNKASEYDSLNQNALYSYAEACRNFFDYKEASVSYQKIYRLDQGKDFPLALFWLGTMQKSLSLYKLAAESFHKFVKEYSHKDIFFEKAMLETNVEQFTLAIYKDTMPVIIQHLDKNINSTYSEFGAMLKGNDQLYFSSLRPVFESSTDIFFANQYISKIYSSKLTRAGWAKSVEMDKKINAKNSNNANPVFAYGGKKMFFSRCLGDYETRMKCAIYVSEYQNGKWQKAYPLGKEINLPDYTSTMPCFVSDENFKILFFVSNRPGGYGGNDIWYSIFSNGKFQQASNLGSAINTQGNEITPYYSVSEKTLYFSSDWHTGLGGYDIFKSKGGLNEWDQPSNIGIPLNSSFNDLYFTINHSDSTGFLSSNRAGSQYFNKGNTCCNDIYSYKWQATYIKTDSVLIVDTVSVKQRIKHLLPLTLYFHNDIPDPKSTASVTNENYKNTLIEYFQLKNIYKKEYSRGLKDKEEEKAKLEIEDLFENKIGKGFSDLEIFSGLLLQDLNSGSEVKIRITGFTSPLNSEKYNYNLANRRISSLINYLREYNDGALIPFIENSHQKGGKLTIISNPVGEALVNPYVSDNPNDKRNSVFSRSAAFERKIQIDLYSSGDEFELSSKAKLYAKLTLISDSFFVGLINHNENKTINLVIQNTGNDNLNIEKIKTSKEYIKTSDTKISITPGSFYNFAILVEASRINGNFTEYIEIFSNSLTGTKKITIFGKVVEE